LTSYQSSAISFQTFLTNYLTTDDCVLMTHLKPTTLPALKNPATAGLIFLPKSSFKKIFGCQCAFYWSSFLSNFLLLGWTFNPFCILQNEIQSVKQPFVPIRLLFEKPLYL